MLGADLDLQVPGLRVLQRLVGIVGRRIGHLVVAQPLAPSSRVRRPEDRRQHLDQVVLVLDALQALGKARVLASASGRSPPAGPPRTSGRGQVDRDPLSVGAFEGVGLRHDRARQRPHDLADAVVVGEAVEVEVAIASSIEMSSGGPCRCRALEQRGEDAHGGVLAGDRVGDGRADDARVRRGRQQAQVADAACATVS
jgi:hypothetical protein